MIILSQSGQFLYLYLDYCISCHRCTALRIYLFFISGFANGDIGVICFCAYGCGVIPWA